MSDLSQWIRWSVLAVVVIFTGFGRTGGDDDA